MSGVHFGAFWEDFGAVWEPFGRPKVRKSGPKSIPKIIIIWISNFHDFYWFLVGLLSQKPLKTIGFSMVSCKSCFCNKLDLGTKKVRFLELKMVQNRSSGAINRVQKSIIILGRKKEGPKSRKVRSKSRFLPCTIAFLDPRVLGNEHCLWLLDTSKSMLFISQRLWAKAWRIIIVFY